MRSLRGIGHLVEKNANLGDFLKCLNNNELQNTLVFSVCQQGTLTGSERYFDLVRKVR